MRRLRTFYVDDDGPPPTELGGVEYEITPDRCAASS
jgi:hypothetical protein